MDHTFVPEFESARDLYLSRTARRGLSPSTVTSYHRHIDRFLDFLSQRRRRQHISDIRPADVQAYRRHLSRASFAEATCSQAIAIIDKWLHFLAEAGLANSGAFPAGSSRKRKWSQEKIIATIRKLRRQGIAMTYPGLRKAGHGNLTNAACRYFGSLSKAIAAADQPAAGAKAQKKKS